MSPKKGASREQRRGPKLSKGPKKDKQSDKQQKQQQVCSTKNSDWKTIDHNCVQTPCKQMAELEIKAKVKPAKLLGSKSLSQFIPRSLFFRSNHSKTNSQGQSFANKMLKSNSVNVMVGLKPPSDLSTTSTPDSIGEKQQCIANRVNSVSLIGLPRQSTSNSLDVDWTVEAVNFSPISGQIPDRSKSDHVFSSSPRQRNVADHRTSNKDRDCEISGDINRATSTSNEQTPEQSNSEADSNHIKNKKKSQNGNYKPFKNTKLVLRDVKNSLGLRMKAKHESQAFSKLTNEISTPPTKLYSPFNIYTPDSGKKEHNTRQKRKQALKLHESFNDSISSNANNSCSTSESERETPKRRIASHHKKHLIEQTRSKFTFVSPTGKLRETVKDVEHFQQCIEDISVAIKLRDQKP